MVAVPSSSPRHHSSSFSSSDKSKKQALCNHLYEQGDRKFSCTILGKHTITALLLLTITLIAVGSSISSFAFEFKGATGFVLELLGESRKTSYSVISLGNNLPNSSDNPHSFGIRWIQATYFTFIVAVPLAHLLVLLFLWLTPLTVRVQRKVFVVIEVFNAWSAVEVFVISIIAALLEIRQFAAFMVGDKCDQINPILKQYFSDELLGDDICFDVVATLDKGCWILFSACFIYIFVLFVMKTCHTALKAHSQSYQHTEVNSMDSEVSHQEEKCNRGLCFGVGKLFRCIKLR